jgi:peroxiredoxin
MESLLIDSLALIGRGISHCSAEPHGHTYISQSHRIGASMPTPVPPTTTIADRSAPPGSVQANLDRLQADREAAWSTEEVEAHASKRLRLEVQADWTRIVKEGDVVENFTLAEVDGGTVVLTELLVDGPVVLIFFRFEGCPACNAAWTAYRESLVPALHELGAHLVAVSPQVPEKLVAFKRRHDLDIHVASDPDGSLLRRFGIAFAPSHDERSGLREEGKDLGAILGAGHWDLPYPTAVVVGQDHVVHFADAHPDWMVRTESRTIIDAVRALSPQVSA